MDLGKAIGSPLFNQCDITSTLMSAIPMDITSALKDENIIIDKKNILLEEPIKALGIYSVNIKLHSQVTAELKIWVVKE